MAASKTRSKREIEGDLETRRTRLAGSIEDLVDQVHPKRVKQRTVSQGKKFVAGEVAAAKSLVFNARGDLRTERVATAGGVFGAVVALLIGLRTLLKRRRRKRAAATDRSERTVERPERSRRRRSS